ncbi:hypothetical protein JZ751_019941 [Albula glossodonta]|uniref:Vacuolar ATPase assembly protein VMA22 n=1 Tax=Albula glossodonta TaxID=121402 RepID=A0A8T2MRZ5_9TELE|nr:hypothetical protein JZ751_019941 [Albula glossodonta]
MGVVVKELSLRLDQCLVRFMDELESLEEKRDSLNSLIEQGWFSISKARYSMGNKQVSALQYGSEMEPGVRVHVRYTILILIFISSSKLNEHGVTRGSGPTLTLPLVLSASRTGETHFHTQRTEHLKLDQSERDSAQVEDIGPKEGVRRRGVTKEGDPKEQPASHAHVSKETSPPSRGTPQQQDPLVSKETSPPSRGTPQQQDPLKWFGILVPQSLKQAQVCFRKVMELAAEVATLQTAVLATRAELQALMAEKHAALKQETLPSQADEQVDRQTDMGHTETRPTEDRTT